MDAGARPRPSRPRVLARVALPKAGLERLNADFEVVTAATPDAFAAVLRDMGTEIDALIQSGPYGLSAQELAAMPNLGIITVQGAGYDKLDVEAAKRQGIVITTGQGTTAFAVAEHAVMLTLAALRGVILSDRAVREGKWTKGDVNNARPMLYGKKVGILGLGLIGTGIAERITPFQVEIGYHNRSPKQGVPYRYFGSPRELAAFADVLILSCPGGAATRGIVDAATIAALGPQGYLINVARGSVVDSAAMIRALETGGIAGAALDVIDGEPVVPEALTRLSNVTLTPHVAARSPEAIDSWMARIHENMKAFFAGKELVSRIA